MTSLKKNTEKLFSPLCDLLKKALDNILDDTNVTNKAKSLSEDSRLELSQLMTLKETVIYFLIMKFINEIEINLYYSDLFWGHFFSRIIILFDASNQVKRLQVLTKNLFKCS